MCTLTYLLIQYISILNVLLSTVLVILSSLCSSLRSLFLHHRWITIVAVRGSLSHLFSMLWAGYDCSKAKKLIIDVVQIIKFDFYSFNGSSKIILAVFPWPPTASYPLALQLWVEKSSKNASCWSVLFFKCDLDSLWSFCISEISPWSLMFNQ